MASTVIRDVLIKLGVDSKGADKAVKTLDSGLVGFVKTAKTAAVAATAVAAAVTAMAAPFVLAAQAAAEFGDEIDKGAQRIADTTDAYQELTFWLSQTGVELTQGEQAISKTVKAVGELKEGTGKAAEALESIGLRYRDLRNLSPTESLVAVSEALAGVEGDTKRLRIAQSIYGEELAGRLLPLLNQGADGLNAMSGEARELGLILDEDAIAASVKFTDTLDKLTRVIKILFVGVGGELLPVLTKMAEATIAWTAANRELLQSGIEQFAALGIDALRLFVRVAEAADSVVRNDLGGWDNVFAGVTVAVQLLWTWFKRLAAVALLFGAPLIGLFLVVQDLMVMLRGGDSVLGRFLDRFREAKGPLGSVARLVEKVIEVGGRLFPVVRKIGEIWFQVFGVTMLPLLKALGSALLFMADVALDGFATVIDNVVIPALEGLVGLLEFALGLLDSLAGATPLVDAIGAALSGLDALSGVSPGALAPNIGAGGGVLTGTGGGISEAPGGFDTSAFLPTVESVAGAAAAPAAGQTNVTQTNTLNAPISGLGLSESQVRTLLTNLLAELNRQSAESLKGAEV